MFKKILISGLMRSALLALCLGSGAAQAAVTVSVGSPVSAGMATFTLNSGTATTGYLTVLQGTGATCGSVTDIQAGKASGGTTDAYRRGSLALAASTNASYTVRNLAAGVGYTVCATDTAGTNVASATFTTPAMATYASPQWQAVDGAASDGASQFPSLSFAPDGTPYVAYSDSTNSGKTTVKRLVSGSWALVGPAGFSGMAIYQSLSFAPDGTPYVVYAEGTYSDHIQVMRWDGSTWSPVGSVINASYISSVSLSFAPDGTPYVAYERVSTTTVNYFNGTTWTAVGAAMVNAKQPSLSFAPDGTPYVAYLDGSASLNGAATVKRYNGSVWVDVGTAGFSAATVFDISLAFAPNGTPYVAYRANGTNQMTVMSYDSGSGWQVVGTGLPVGSGPSLSFAPDGTPYVVYRSGTSPYTSEVVRLVGTTWVSVGAAVSSGDSNSPSLSFAPDGTPYVAYRDSSNKTIVKRLVSVPGAPTAVTAVAGNGQATVSFTAPASNGGSVITSYTVTTDPAGGVTGTCTASPCTVTGLTNGTPYTFTVAATNGVGSSAASGASGSVTPAASSTISIVGSPVVSAGMVTVTLNSSATGTGYLTVLEGNSAVCGLVANIQAGKASGGATDAYRRGALALAANTNANYTVRNLAQSTAYTLCAADGAGSPVVSANFTTPAMATYANPGWQAVGGAVSGPNTYNQSLAFAPDGKPYVAYRDYDNTNYTAKVQRYNGTAWEAAGVQTGLDAQANNQSLSFAPDGTPYVVYIVGISSSKNIRVRRWDGTAWSAVGADLSVSTFSALSGLNLSFAPNGTPYMAYSAGLVGLNVLRYDGSAWLPVGTAIAYASDVSLVIAPDGVPYMAYAANGGKTTVQRYTGGAWQSVGAAEFSSGIAGDQSLAFAPNGTPYVAYWENGTKKITVQSYDSTNGWVTVGDSTTHVGSDPSLSFAPDGTPYVAYRGNAPSQTKVMRYSSTSWELVGAAVSSGSSDFPSLSFAPDGTPYVAYQDVANGGKTIVKRFVEIVVPGAPTGVTAVAGNGQATVSFTAPASNGGSVITGYTVTSSGGQMCTATAPATSCVVTGLTNGTPYTFTVAATNGVGSSAASGVSAAVTPAASSTISIVGSPAASAGMVTVTLNSSATGTGYLTVLQGTGASCGTAANIQAGKASGGTTDAYRRGSLALVANTSANYTVRNLAQSTAYTLCAADGAGSAVVSKTFTTPAMATYANPGWQAVGGAVSGGLAYYQSLAFAPNGTPYVAYRDASNKTTVMRLNGTAWELVGSAGFSAGVAEGQSLSFAPDGTPYVAYRDGTKGDKVTVMRYSSTGWVTVGSTGFSAGAAWFYLSLSIAPDGTPHVAYMDIGNSNKTTVMYFDAAVDAWKVAGTAGFSAGRTVHHSLTFAPDGTPYVAYGDESYDGRTTVMYFDATAAAADAWKPVGSPGFSTGIAQYQSLSFSPSGTLYVAYMDYATTPINKVTVMRYSGGDWTAVGSAGFSSQMAQYPSLSFAPDDTPYVAYSDHENGDKTTVMRWTGTSRENMGSTGFSAGEAKYQSLSFAPDGTPYVAYQDGGDGNKTIVKRLVGLPGAPTAVTAVAGDGQATVSFTAPASNGGSAITGYTVTAKLAASPYTEVASCTPNPVLSTSCVVTGLTNGTAYTITVTANNAGGASAASVPVAVTPAAAATPVVGACGSAHSTTPLLTSAPSTGLCTAGTAGSVTIGTSAYTWACAGSGSGANSGTCSASRGYTVTPSAGTGGSISPAGVQTVAYNATQVFTFTADSGNTAAITSNTCGGALSGSTYTSAAITADCTVTASFTASADTTAPSITNLALSGTPTRSSAGVTVTVNESSTGYWLLVASGSTAPTAAQVVAGVNYAPVTVSAKGHLALAAGTAATINLTGLATGTAYTLYLVAQDASNNQSAIGQVAFITTQISLNDTGQTSCYSPANAVAPCDAATAGDTGTGPHQDGRYGRDVAGMSKVGGGAAGFDFTRICWNGAAEGAATCTGLLVANTTDTASATPATDWACTKDNVTGLVWSLQSKMAHWSIANAPSYADAGHNSSARCGFSADWRMPTRRELLSIVHNGLSTGPVVDVAYFPGTQANRYWSSNSSVGSPSEAAFVNFVEGRASFDEKPNNQFVRLVRSAP